LIQVGRVYETPGEGAAAPAGIAGTVRGLWRAEGARGFTRGMSSPRR
jgi:hypothetical protein